MNSAVISVTPDFQKTKNAAFSKNLLMSTLAIGGVAASVSAPVQAQTAIDVTTVSAQTASATTAITTVGVTLLSMAFGLLVFRVATNVIRRVMGS